MNIELRTLETVLEDMLDEVSEVELLDFMYWEISKRDLVTIFKETKNNRIKNLIEKLIN